jgi:hypothetical protein
MLEYGILPSHTAIVTVMMDALRSSKTSVLTRATRLHIPEDDILYRHHREDLKPYISLTGLGSVAKT